MALARGKGARPPAGPEGLGEILGRTIGREARRRRGVDSRVRRKWEEVAGPEIASRTSVMGLRRSVLRVRVESSALLAELAGIYRNDLIASLAEGEDPVFVRTIRFEIAGASPEE